MLTMTISKSQDWVTAKTMTNRNTGGRRLSLQTSCSVSTQPVKGGKLSSEAFDVGTSPSIVMPHVENQRHSVKHFYEEKKSVVSDNVSMHLNVNQQKLSFCQSAECLLSAFFETSKY
jgi:hypothetical protein